MLFTSYCLVEVVPPSPKVTKADDNTLADKIYNSNTTGKLSQHKNYRGEEIK